MITRIEASNFRCFQALAADMGEFELFVGANGAGKSTLVTIPAFIHDVMLSGPEHAVFGKGAAGLVRALRAGDLVFGRQGQYAELAIEVRLPYHVQKALRGRYSSARIEMTIELCDTSRPGLVYEALWLRPERTAVEAHSGVSGDTHNSPDWRQVALRDTINGVQWVSPEVGSHDPVSKKLLMRVSLLGSIDQDDSRFPAYVWIRSLLEMASACYWLNPEKMRAACAPSNTISLEGDGANLAWVVRNLAYQDAERFQRWIDHVRTALPEIQRIEGIEREADHHAFIRIHFAGGFTIDGPGLSDGTLRILGLTILAYAPPPPGTIVVEEPEVGVHPRGIEAIMQSLNGLYGAQVLVTTHSPVVVASCPAERILVFQKEQNGAVTVIRGAEHPRLRDWYGSRDLGTLFAAGVFG
ncbi:MAG: AAA family ATPase [Acidobacteriota bacterium]